MKKFLYGTVLAGALGILIGVILSPYLAHRDKLDEPTAEAASSSTDTVLLPDIIFDATTTIPETSVSFAYSKDGFYGFGARIARHPAAPDSAFPSFLGGAAIISTAELGNTGYLASLSVGVDKLKAGQTLRNIVESGDLNGIDIKYRQKSGSFVTIGGHEFFIYKEVINPYYSTAWKALAVGKKEAVSVIFDFDTGTTPIAQTAFRNNDGLFFQILSHVDFE